MWLFYFVAALVVLVAGVGGSFVVTLRLMPIPAGLEPYRPLIENVGVALGLGLSLLGVALLYRKVGRLGRRRGASSGRTGRTRRLVPPGSLRQAPPEPDRLPGGRKKEAPAAVDETSEKPIPFPGLADEPVTRRLPKVRPEE